MSTIRRSNPSLPDSVFAMLSMRDKVAIITGGAGGIGYQVARGLAEAGANIALWYNTSTQAELLAATIAKDFGVTAKAYQCDVQDFNKVQSVRDAVLADFGRLDVMIANAGIPSKGGGLDDRVEDWHRVVDVDFSGAYYCARVAGEVFRKQGSGSLIFTSSMSGHAVNVPQQQACYNACKAGIIHLAKSLAVEWAGFARVNSISPGYIDTAISGDCPIEMKDEWYRLTPLRRDADPRELKGAYLYLASDANFVLESPIVLGHESSGTVVEVGPAVKNVKVGDRVAIEPGVPCRHCDYCRSGSYNLCPDTVFAATPPHDGTLSKYYITQADYCYPIPSHMDLEEGALVEPVAVATQITKVGNVRPNQTVVVFGCGPIGLLCQNVCKAYAAKKVIGVDISPSRLEFAKSFGVDGVFLPPAKPAEVADDSEWSATVARMIKEEFALGDGPDVVLEATGAQSCIQTGVQLCRKGGMYVQAGMGKENVVFPITTACIRDLTIRGSIRYSTGCYPTAVDLIASGKIDVKRLVSNRYTFEQAEDAFELVRQGKESVIKVMIEGYRDK